MRVILIIVLAVLLIGVMVVGGSLLFDRVGNMMNANRRAVKRRSAGMDFLYDGSSNSNQEDEMAASGEDDDRDE